MLGDLLNLEEVQLRLWVLMILLLRKDDQQESRSTFLYI